MTRQSLHQKAAHTSNFWVRYSYGVFHGFGQAKFAEDGLILGSSKFTPLKMVLNLKVVKIYSKILLH